MKNIQYFFQRHLISTPISLTAWVYFLIGTNMPFIASTGLFFAIYFSSTLTIKQFQINSTMKRFNLTRSEYRYIDHQIKSASRKLKQLNSYYGKVRSVQAFRQLHEMNLISRRIINTVKTTPTKFYHVENFFYSHLDSAVELTSKYAMLVNQPLKDNEVQLALENTRNTLKDVNEQLELDLRNAYATDIENLKIELDYVDVMMNRKKEQPLLETKGEDTND